MGDSVSDSWTVPVVVGHFGTDGADGADGADGTNGTDGTDGTNGTDGTSYFPIFIRQSSEPSKAAGTISSGTYSPPSGWTLSVPTGSDILWTQPIVIVPGSNPTSGGVFQAAGDIPDASIDAGTKLVLQSITNTVIADDAIRTPHLLAGAVTATKVAASAITGEKIAAGTITADDAVFANAAIQSADIDSLEASQIRAGVLDVGIILSGTVRIGDRQIQAIHDTPTVSDPSTSDLILLSDQSASGVATWPDWAEASPHGLTERTSANIGSATLNKLYWWDSPAFSDAIIARISSTQCVITSTRSNQLGAHVVVADVSDMPTSYAEVNALPEWTAGVIPDANDMTSAGVKWLTISSANRPGFTSSSGVLVAVRGSTMECAHAWLQPVVGGGSFTQEFQRFTRALPSGSTPTGGQYPNRKCTVQALLTAALGLPTEAGRYFFERTSSGVNRFILDPDADPYWSAWVPHNDSSLPSNLIGNASTNDLNAAANSVHFNSFLHARDASKRGLRIASNQAVRYRNRSGSSWSGGWSGTIPAANKTTIGNPSATPKFVTLRTGSSGSYEFAMDGLSTTRWLNSGSTGITWTKSGKQYMAVVQLRIGSDTASATACAIASRTAP